MRNGLIAWADSGGNKFAPAARQRKRSTPQLPTPKQLERYRKMLPKQTRFRVYCPSLWPSPNVPVSLSVASKPSVIFPKNSIPQSSFQCRRGCPDEYLIILDLEATCDYSPNPVVDRETAEIIEWSWVTLNVPTLEEVHSEQIYVQPDNLEGLTPYCRALTHITRAKLENAVSLAGAVARFESYISDNFRNTKFHLCTDGIWDLQVQVFMEFRRKNIPADKFFYNEYYDVKTEFANLFPWFYRKATPALGHMLEAFNLDFVGQHHSGIDDCRSIAQLVKLLLPFGNCFTKLQKIPRNYQPFSDPRWMNFPTVSPEHSWQCTNVTCGVWNPPHYASCRFCQQEHFHVCARCGSLSDYTVTELCKLFPPRFPELHVSSLFCRSCKRD